MKMIYTIAAMLLATNVAVAADANNDISEFHQHAMQGQLEVTPHVMYDMNTANAGGAGAADVDTNGFRLGSEVEYGVMDRLSVGADLTYRSWDTDAAGGAAASEETGLEDLVLFTRGSNPMSAGRLTYGANLGINLEDASADNATTGGMSLRPYVGYEMMAGPGLWGAQLNYTYLAERTGVAGSKAEGGGGLGAATFYEYGMSENMSLGAALRYNMYADSETQAGVSLQDERNDLGVSVYAPIGLQNNMTVIPRLDWTSSDFATGGGEASNLGIGAALRWMM